MHLLGEQQSEKDKKVEGEANKSVIYPVEADNTNITIQLGQGTKDSELDFGLSLTSGIDIYNGFADISGSQKIPLIGRLLTWREVLCYLNNEQYSKAGFVLAWSTLGGWTIIPEAIWEASQTKSYLIRTGKIYYNEWKYNEWQYQRTGDVKYYDAANKNLRLMDTNYKKIQKR